MKFTAKQEDRILRLYQEGKQPMLDDAVIKHLGWSVVPRDKCQGLSAYINDAGYKVNNLSAFRHLAKKGLNPVELAGIHFKDERLIRRSAKTCD